MKLLIARLFNLDLVAVEFGFSHSTRFLRYSPDGVPFVWILGCVIRLDNPSPYGSHNWIWLHRRRRSG